MIKTGLLLSACARAGFNAMVFCIRARRSALDAVSNGAVARWHFNKKRLI